MGASYGSPLLLLYDNALVGAYYDTFVNCDFTEFHDCNHVNCLMKLVFDTLETLLIVYVMTSLGFSGHYMWHHFVK